MQVTVGNYLFRMIYYFSLPRHILNTLAYFLFYGAEFAVVWKKRKKFIKEFQNKQLLSGKCGEYM